MNEIIPKFVLIARSINYRASSALKARNEALHIFMNNEATLDSVSTLET